ncbi:hypothetical protein [Rhodococcus sovatensis]|uniref:Uncharacterized protein n=1 Tax=Rhodococcus sovatensis TaxID=1805840 RepID=A0ABZ2PP43_9NOCA
MPETSESAKHDFASDRLVVSKCAECGRSYADDVHHPDFDPMTAKF